MHMIQQTAKGLNSRSEANPYNEDGFLPLITAPMSSVINEINYADFQNANIQLCFPRTTDFDKLGDYTWKSSFHAISLNEFINDFVKNTRPLTYTPTYRCIDTANGNIPELHSAIRKAKEIHGDNLVIMAGNVASVEAFVELAKTGVDYIRVGIGGGGGCNTTANTGVGQEDLKKLIANCNEVKDLSKHYSQQELQHGATFFKVPSFTKDPILGIPQEFKNISKAKIVADGISSYIKQCESKYGFNDNGYAAINKLLFAGADLVMVGKLFAQCIESAGEKHYDGPIQSASGKISAQTILSKHPYVKKLIDNKEYKYLQVKYSGMSTQEEQKKYKSIPTIRVIKDNLAPGTLVVDRDFLKKGDKIKYNNSELTITQGPYGDGIEKWYGVEDKIIFKVGEELTLVQDSIKPSEGSIQWIPVRWTLNEWLNGSDKQDEAPYLMGWINSIKSTMAYTGKTKL